MKKLGLPILLLMVFLYVGWQGLNLYDDLFPFGRMWETPAIRPHESVFSVMDAGSVPITLGEAKYKTLDENEIASPLAGKEPEYASEGMELYDTYCAQCHGKYLDGNGTVGQSFSPVPTDLRNPQVQGYSDGLIFKHLSYGNPPNGRQPPLATTIAIADRWKIIAYIRMAGVQQSSSHEQP